MDRGYSMKVIALIILIAASLQVCAGDSIDEVCKPYCSTYTSGKFVKKCWKLTVEKRTCYICQRNVCHLISYAR